MNMMSPMQWPEIESSVIEANNHIVMATYIKCSHAVGVCCGRCAGADVDSPDTIKCPVCAAYVGSGGMVVRCSCGVRLFRCRALGGFRCIHENIINLSSDSDEI